MIPLISADTRRVLGLIAQRASGQLAVFVSSLYVVKLVQPETYATLGLYASLCSLLSIAMALRLDNRALVCRTEEGRERYIGLAYLCSTVLFMVGTMIVLVASLVIQVPLWLMLLPAGVFLNSLVLAVIPSQHSSYSDLSRVGRMTQIVSVSTALLQIVGAALSPTAVALVGSRIVSAGLGASTMYECVLRGYRSARSLSWRVARRMLLASRKEIFFGMPASVISVIELQTAVYVFSLYKLHHSVGLYWLSFNLLFVPYLVVSSSLRPVMLKSIAKRRGRTDMPSFMVKLLCAFSIGGAFAVAAMVAASWMVVDMLIGGEWSGASSFSLLLGISLLPMIAKTPFVIGSPALGLQRLNLLFGLFQVGVRVASLSASLSSGMGPVHALGIMVALSFAVDAVYICLALRSTQLETTSTSRV